MKFIQEKSHEKRKLASDLIMTSEANRRNAIKTNAVDVLPASWLIA
jgi:hypothetical protein